MNRHRPFIFLATCGALSLAAEESGVPRMSAETKAKIAEITGASDVEGLTPEDLTTLTPVFESIRGAPSVVVLEGLPHYGFEARVFKEEVATKEVVPVHDYTFYKRPLEVVTNDVESLKALSGDALSFSHFGGSKMCGGFHPDYCLVWKNGEATFQALFCLGCHEVKIYGPQIAWYGDIGKEAYEKFRSLLTKYRDQRPASQPPKTNDLQIKKPTP